MSPRQTAASRDSRLTLRRVERQQHLIEHLQRAGERTSFRRLADDLGVSERTIARDVARLRHSGVPIAVTPGRGGGARIATPQSVAPIALDVPEIAALMASLAALGPTATESAASAMRKLVSALRPDDRASDANPGLEDSRHG